MLKVVFADSRVSEQGHDGSCFLRGVVAELEGRGHQVHALVAKGRRRPTLETFDLDAELDGADLVLVSALTDPELIAQIGAHRARHDDYRLLFHDTRRTRTAPKEASQLDLSSYDGVLAGGEALRRVYLERGWAARAWTWHEAVDTRVFHPLSTIELEADLVLDLTGGRGRAAARAARIPPLPRPQRPPARTPLRRRLPGVGPAAHRLSGLRYCGPKRRRSRSRALRPPSAHRPRLPGGRRALHRTPRRVTSSRRSPAGSRWSAPPDDAEGLFRPEQDYLLARDCAEMREAMQACILRVPRVRRAVARKRLGDDPRSPHLRPPGRRAAGDRRGAERGQIGAGRLKAIPTFGTWRIHNEILEWWADMDALIRGAGSGPKATPAGASTSQRSSSTPRSTSSPTACAPTGASSTSAANRSPSSASASTPSATSAGWSTAAPSTSSSSRTSTGWASRSIPSPRWRCSQRPPKPGPRRRLLGRLPGDAVDRDGRRALHLGRAPAPREQGRPAGDHSRDLGPLRLPARRSARRRPRRPRGAPPRRQLDRRGDPVPPLRRARQARPQRRSRPLLDPRPAPRPGPRPHRRAPPPCSISRTLDFIDHYGLEALAAHTRRLAANGGCTRPNRRPRSSTASASCWRWRCEPAGRTSAGLPPRGVLLLGRRRVPRRGRSPTWKRGSPPGKRSSSSFRNRVCGWSRKRSARPRKR